MNRVNRLQAGCGAAIRARQDAGLLPAHVPVLLFGFWFLPTPLGSCGVAGTIVLGIVAMASWGMKSRLDVLGLFGH